MLKIETRFDRYNEDLVNARLDALPPSWRARALRYMPFDARLRSAIGYTLLAELLKDAYDLAPLPLVTDVHGKPYFENSPLHFSISHCQNAVAVIVEEQPVGLDVQDILYDARPALRARIAAPLSPDELDDRALTALWTQKEASAKLDGRGLSIGLEHLPLQEHRLETRFFEHFALTVARL